MAWHSESKRGEGIVLNISPGGAAFEVPATQAFRIGSFVSLGMRLTECMEWRVANRAAVLRKVPRSNGLCEVVVQFDEPYIEPKGNGRRR